jgi:transposase
MHGVCARRSAGRTDDEQDRSSGERRHNRTTAEKVCTISDYGCAVVGVDEWAKRKGLVFGTIILDLERRAVMDVLDKHSTQAVEKWLLAHLTSTRFVGIAMAGTPRPHVRVRQPQNT